AFHAWREERKVGARSAAPSWTKERPPKRAAELPPAPPPPPTSRAHGATANKADRCTPYGDNNDPSSLPNAAIRRVRPIPRPCYRMSSTNSHTFTVISSHQPDSTRKPGGGARGCGRRPR